MQPRGFRSWSLLILLWAACSAEPAPPVPGKPPAVVRRLATPITDVAMLQLQPDGSYRRVCGRPRPEVQVMMDGLHRSRRAPR
jgi:hypothetical protein